MICRANTEVIIETPVTSLLYRGSPNLVVGFPHLSSGSRIVSAWGVLRFLLVGRVLIGGIQSLLLGLVQLFEGVYWLLIGRV